MDVQDLGIIGIFTILLLRSILDFLKERNGQAAPTKDSMRQALEPIRLELSEVRDDTRKLREHSHTIQSTLQTITGRTEILVRQEERRARPRN